MVRDLILCFFCILLSLPFCHWLNMYMYYYYDVRFNIQMHIWTKHIIIVMKKYFKDDLILWHVVLLGNIKRNFDWRKKKKKKGQSLPTLKIFLVMLQETWTFFFWPNAMSLCAKADVLYSKHSVIASQCALRRTVR